VGTRQRLFQAHEEGWGGQKKDASGGWRSERDANGAANVTFGAPNMTFGAPNMTPYNTGAPTAARGEVRTVGVATAARRTLATGTVWSDASSR